MAGGSWPGRSSHGQGWSLHTGPGTRAGGGGVGGCCLPAACRSLGRLPSSGDSLAGSAGENHPEPLPSPTHSEWAGSPVAAASSRRRRSTSVAGAAGACQAPACPPRRAPAEEGRRLRRRRRIDVATRHPPLFCPWKGGLEAKVPPATRPTAGHEADDGCGAPRGNCWGDRQIACSLVCKRMVLTGVDDLVAKSVADSPAGPWTSTQGTARRRAAEQRITVVARDFPGGCRMPWRIAPWEKR